MDQINIIPIFSHKNEHILDQIRKIKELVDNGDVVGGVAWIAIVNDRESEDEDRAVVCGWSGVNFPIEMIGAVEMLKQRLIDEQEMDVSDE